MGVSADTAAAANRQQNTTVNRTDFELTWGLILDITVDQHDGESGRRRQILRVLYIHAVSCSAAIGSQGDELRRIVKGV